MILDARFRIEVLEVVSVSVGLDKPNSKHETSEPSDRLTSDSV